MMGKWWKMMGKWWNMMGKWRNMMKNHEILGRISTWVWLKMGFFGTPLSINFVGKMIIDRFWGALFSNNPKLFGAPQWCLGFINHIKSPIN
jgi:hypothetical protein